MSDNDSSTTGASRRETLKYGAVLAASGTIAGCSNRLEEGGNSGAANTPGGSYEVCMEPVGCQTFEGVPGSFTVYSPAMGDIMTVLGHIDDLAAIRRPGENFPTRHFERLPGVEIDMSISTSSPAEQIAPTKRFSTRPTRKST